MYLYVEIFSFLGLSQPTIDFICGFDNGIVSTVLGLVVSWIFYWIFIHLMYYIMGFVIQTLVGITHPTHGTNFVSKDTIWHHITLSEIAFPLYVFVPVTGDFFRKMNWARTCESVESCGGYLPSLIGFGIFFILMEFLVFFDHYYLLHVWKWGKKHLKHDLHHKYERGDEMNVWTGFAFEAVDGFSQGFPISLLQLIIPVPVSWILVLSSIIGCWTMYIHCGEPHLPWPFMGADYHFIHHKYNWFNFGFFTRLFDWLFGTLKHPRKSDYEDETLYDKSGKILRSRFDHDDKNKGNKNNLNKKQKKRKL